MKIPSHLQHLTGVNYSPKNTFYRQKRNFASPGEIADVDGTAFDLRTSTRVGDRVGDTPTGLITDTAGIPLYDHCFRIRGPSGKRAVARYCLPETHPPGTNQQWLTKHMLGHIFMFLIIRHRHKCLIYILDFSESILDSSLYASREGPGINKDMSTHDGPTSLVFLLVPCLKAPYFLL